MNIDLYLKVVSAYKINRISNFIEEDIKQIKKLNQILQRLEKYNKEQYILESMNVLLSLDNIFDINKLYPVICELVDVRFHSTILFLFEKIDNMKNSDYKKLQELANDEEE